MDTYPDLVCSVAPSQFPLAAFNYREGDNGTAEGQPARRGEITATSVGHRSQQISGIRDLLFSSESVWGLVLPALPPGHSSKND